MKIALVLLFSIIFLGCSEEKSTTSIPSAQTTQTPAQVVNKEVEKPVQPPKEEAVSEPVESTPPAAPQLRKSSGMELFSKCVSCHGAKAEKSALGKSQVIAGWPKEKIIEALSGYQNGTYGSTMKGLMAGQVKGLSSDDIDALATYISKQ